MERLEQERNHLKHDNDKLEAKVSQRDGCSFLIVQYLMFHDG